MQRQLHQSLRALCLHRCRHRLYSTQAAVTRALPPDISSDPVVSNSALSVDAKDNSTHEENLLEEPSSSSSTTKKTVWQALLPDPDSNHWVGPNRTDSYLFSLRTEGIEPTIEDLMRLTPKYRPPVESPGYAPAYLELVDRICRAFSKDQLHRFCKELSYERALSKSGRKKVQYVEDIMEKEWGWKNLKEVEQQKREASEVVVKTFPISASELFLLLGKDGSELLHLSSEYNAHISVTPDPLCLRIEGSLGRIKQLKTLMTSRRKSIIEEKIVLPTKEPLPFNLLQRVSRTANAFIENIGSEGEVRIRANNQRLLNMARRLATRAAVQIKHGLETPFAALVPLPSSLPPEESPSSYSLFPFIPQRSLPWTTAEGGTFRSRKVSDGFRSKGPALTSFAPENGNRKGMFISTNGEFPALEDVINSSFQDGLGPFVITASTGHLLVMSSASDRPRSSIIPPFPGRWEYPELLDWLKGDAAHRIFMPCLPPPLHSAPPSQEEIVHRLTYRRIRGPGDSAASREGTFSPDNIIRAEVIINKQKLQGQEGSEQSDAETRFDLVSREDALTREELDGLFIEELQEPSEDQQNTLVEASEQQDSDVGKFEHEDHTFESEPDKLEAATDVKTGESDYEGAEASSENQPVLGSEDVEAEVPHEQIESNSEPICYRAKELEFLVALPDRPMDVKFTVSGSIESAPVSSFPELEKYFDALKAYLDNAEIEHSPPEPPLFIEDGDDKYILELNASIRRSTETVDPDHEPAPDFDSLSHPTFDDRRILTTTESIYDLESGQKLVNCEVTCKEALSSFAWLSFLRDVDEITSLGYKKQPPPRPDLCVDDPSVNEEQLS